MDNLNAINEKIIALKTQIEKRITAKNATIESMSNNESDDNQPNGTNEPEHKGRVIFKDA